MREASAHEKNRIHEQIHKHKENDKKHHQCTAGEL